MNEDILLSMFLLSRQGNPFRLHFDSSEPGGTNFQKIGQEVDGNMKSVSNPQEIVQDCTGSCTYLYKLV